LDDIVQQPSTWCGRSEPILLHPVGCEARKTPADAGVFFLDFYFYRTYQNLGFNVAAMPTLLAQMTVPEERHL
jgi:hypothetical protein